MALKMLEITAPIAAEASLQKIARESGAVNFHKGYDIEDDHAVYFLLSPPSSRQRLIDDLHEITKTSARARINIMSVDATIPALDHDNPSDTREELYAKMNAGARTDVTFLILAALSTVVALIGLIQDNVAVVVGAMVIAPLLGPNLAFALGTALGDRVLMVRAFTTAVNGLVMAVLFAAVTGYLWGYVPESSELLSRTEVGLSSIALAAASGVAGVLSLTSGLSMTLVGVMVAVALLPPAATAGFMLGVGESKMALDAFVLLIVNIVCVNLAGLVVFVAKGLRPRLWFERRMAKPYLYTGLAVWATAFIALIYFL